ncbi:MAG: conserved repeat domain protein, partial [Nocardioides sp.]|nr:conserved repeat domain protein [Nocardioides sp.]
MSLLGGSGSDARRRVLITLSLVAALLALLPSSPAAAADRNFGIRFTANDTGDIDIVGNTVMTCNAAVAGCSAARTAGPTTVANPALNNNNFSMVYVDVDNDASTFNSSQSTLDLPSGATVLFAGLYWGGEVVTGTAAFNARTSIRFKAPGNAAYVDLTATTVDDGALIYQGFVDVTSRVRTAGPGTYTVANLQTVTGSDRLGGWSLVVAYRDTSMPARNLTVFDGLKSINSGASGTISASGFQTPPAGAVNATVGFVNYEGDLGLVGDSATLNGIPLSDAQHPSSNFFDSRSSRNGVLRTGNNPSHPNNLGFEQSMLSVGNTYIANGATSATIGLTSSGDVYAPGVVTIATELYAPRIVQTKGVVDLNGGLVEQGDTLRYTVSGTNNGQDGAVGFVLRDPVPADTTYVPGSLRVTQPGGVATARTDAAGDDVAELDAANDRVVARFGTGASATAGGTIAPGGAYALVFDVVVEGPVPAVPGGTLVRNTATASYNSQSLGTPLTTVSNADVTVAAPDLAVTKTHSGTFVQGTNATFTLGVSNVGNARTQGVVTVTDTLPAGLTFVSASGTGWSCTGTTTVTCTRSDSLAAGAAYPSITLTVAVADAAPATVANTVTVSGGGDAPDDNNSAVDSAPTVAITDLAVTKTPGAATVAVGGDVTYALTVTNNGPSRSTGSTVVDTLPAGMSFVSADAGCVSSPSVSTVTCTLGPIANGASTTVRVTTRPDIGTAGSTLTNAVRVLAHETDPTPGNDTATASVQVRPVDLAITSGIQGAPATLVPGQGYTWRLDVTNLGTSPAADTVVRFAVPDDLVVDAAALDPRCAVDGGDVVCTLGTVGPGAVVPPILVKATVAAGSVSATIDTNAVVGSSEPEADLSNNTAPTSTPVTKAVDLSVAIVAGPTSVGAGDALTLTSTVSNAGPGTPTTPVLTVVIPDGTTFVSADPGCTYAAATRTVTCTLPPGDLQPGESLDRSVVVTVGPDPVDPLTATATVSAPDDTDPSNDTASVVVPVVAYAGVSIVKTVDKTQAAPGDTVTYTLTVTNAGPAGARDVVVTDALPAGTTYAAASAAGGACTQAGPDVTCELGTVPAGTTRVVTITATVDPVTAAPSGTGHQLDVTKVETNVAAPAATAATATATCPSGYLATDGSVRLDAVDQGTGGFADVVVLRSSATADGTGWTGTVRNTTTGQAQAKVLVVCTSTATVSDDGHRHDLLVSDPRTTSTTWTAGTWTVDLSCGAGQLAVAPGSAFTSGEGVVRTSQRNDTDWRFVVDVPESATAVFDVRCLSTSVDTAAGHTHDLDLVQLRDTVTVPPGQTVQATLSCSDQGKGIVASYDVDAGSVALGNDPQPKTRVFRFTNPTSSTLTARIGLLCLETRTGPALAVS